MGRVEARRLTTPVVHDNHAEDVFVRLLNWDWLTEVVALANEERHLQLKVQQTTRSEHGRLS